MTNTDHFDVAVIGAGVIGLAVAQRLSAAPFMADRNLVLLDQEDGVGQHTSSRNSEVIHAGIYYPSGSLKAALCVRGRQLLFEHCQRYRVPCRRTGKLIVASERDSDSLLALQQQAANNGVDDLELLDSGALRRREAQVQADIALFSPSSGIVDSHAFMVSLLHLAQQQGAIFAPRTRVQGICRKVEGFEVTTRLKSSSGIGDEDYRFTTTAIVCCAGLQGPALAKRIEGLDPQLIPQQFLCKGDYFSYSGKSPFQHLIYPLPEANTAGLGIHATLDLAGRLRFGPDTQYVDSEDYTVDPHKRQRFAEAIRRYFPMLDPLALQPDYAGIRPKLAGAGEPATDFIIQDTTEAGFPNLVQLFGIESPGLTASLAIGERVTAMVRNFF
ncbi:MAG: NAD(P)/FAD-dependent oxidoreductase [Gammaproteobacteria bacterium]|nr:NAD(P)/FAD-dependent oxidoreductase [Pseudomonadales bacterium]MCP5346243.1 NAD(P)/FAD-dependent oxidoreductase [Pseudomonadales bacterium]